MLIGPEGLVERNVVSVQRRADVNTPDLLSITTELRESKETFVSVYVCVGLTT